ncbi:hypothetical protein ACUNIA_25305, partial [Serratia sp. IR-2025]
KKSAQIREILISESAWEEMTCLFAPSLVELNDEDSFLANLEYLASNDNVYFQLSAGTCNVSSQFSEERIKSLWRNLVCGK